MSKKEMKGLKTKTEVINGVEYTFQKLDVVSALEMKDRMQGANGVSSVKMARELFEHVVVKPKIEVEDFEDTYEVEEIALAAYQFQYPQPKQNK